MPLDRSEENCLRMDREIQRCGDSGATGEIAPHAVSAVQMWNVRLTDEQLELLRWLVDHEEDPVYANNETYRSTLHALHTGALEPPVDKPKPVVL